MSAIPQQLYREITFTAGLPGLQGFTAKGSKDGGSHISFSIVMDRKKGPNKAEVVIHNLSRAKIALLEATGSVGTLSAGYELRVQQMFDGDIIQLDSKRTAKGTATKAFLGHGEVAYKEAEFSATIGGDVPYASIVAQIGVAMLLPVSPSAVDLTGSSLGGWTFFGKARDALTEIARAVGADWSIQDGAIIFTNGDTPTAEQAVLLSDTSGLLTTERIHEKRNKKSGKVLQRSGWKFTTLLNPGFRPGRIVSVISTSNPEVNGFFTINRASHVGDSKQGKFRSVIEAREATLA